MPNSNLGILDQGWVSRYEQIPNILSPTGLFLILNSLGYPKLIVLPSKFLPGTCSRMKLLITHSI